MVPELKAMPQRGWANLTTAADEDRERGERLRVKGGVQDNFIINLRCYTYYKCLNSPKVNYLIWI